MYSETLTELSYTMKLWQEQMQFFFEYLLGIAIDILSQVVSMHYSGY